MTNRPAATWNFEDDPRLTAYALGELPEGERAEIDALLVGNAAAQRFVEETRGLAAGPPVERLHLCHVHPVLLAQDIQALAAADRVEPRREVTVHLVRARRDEPQEGLLHRVAGPVGVAEQPRRVRDQRALVGHEGSFDPRVACGAVGSVHHPGLS